MALELHTAGMFVKTAPEATSGTRPTSGYTALTSIKRIGSLNPEPNALDVTDLSDTEFKRYIIGLKDTGGALTLGANHTESFMTEWGSLCDTADSLASESKAFWMEIGHPKLTKSFFLRIIPSPMGLNEVGVDAPLEIDVYVSPNKVAGWAAKSTT